MLFELGSHGHSIRTGLPHRQLRRVQQFFSVAEKYEFWLASPDENAAIGISIR
jgi:hypothetical protein